LAQQGEEILGNLLREKKLAMALEAAAAATRATN